MSDRLRVAGLVLAGLGIALATYLVYVHYSGSNPVCTAGATCQKVQTSQYSKLAGIPVAVLGLAGYIAIFAALALRRELADLAASGLAISGFLFSGYLTYREVFTLELICEQCVTSAVLMTALMGITVALVAREP